MSTSPARTCTLYVGGLPPETDTDALKTLFAEFGEVADARVVMRSTTGRCRGFGYVTFVTARAAALAKSAVDGRLMAGGRLRVAEAT